MTWIQGFYVVYALILIRFYAEIYRIQRRTLREPGYLESIVAKKEAAKKWTDFRAYPINTGVTFIAGALLVYSTPLLFQHPWFSLELFLVGIVAVTCLFVVLITSKMKGFDQIDIWARTDAQRARSLYASLLTIWCIGSCMLGEFFTFGGLFGSSVALAFRR